MHTLGALSVSRHASTTAMPWLVPAQDRRSTAHPLMVLPYFPCRMRTSHCLRSGSWLPAGVVTCLSKPGQTILRPDLSTCWLAQSVDLTGWYPPRTAEELPTYVWYGCDCSVGCGPARLVVGRNCTPCRLLGPSGMAQKGDRAQQHPFPLHAVNGAAACHPAFKPLADLFVLTIPHVQPRTHLALP